MASVVNPDPHPTLIQAVQAAVGAVLQAQPSIGASLQAAGCTRTLLLSALRHDALGQWQGCGWSRLCAVLAIDLTVVAVRVIAREFTELSARLGQKASRRRESQLSRALATLDRTRQTLLPSASSAPNEAEEYSSCRAALLQSWSAAGGEAALLDVMMRIDGDGSGDANSAHSSGRALSIRIMTSSGGRALSSSAAQQLDSTAASDGALHNTTSELAATSSWTVLERQEQPEDEGPQLLQLLAGAGGPTAGVKAYPSSAGYGDDNEAAATGQEAAPNTDSLRFTTSAAGEEGEGVAASVSVSASPSRSAALRWDPLPPSSAGAGRWDAPAPATYSGPPPPQSSTPSSSVPTAEETSVQPSSVTSSGVPLAAAPASLPPAVTRGRGARASSLLRGAPAIRVPAFAAAAQAAGPAANFVPSPTVGAARAPSGSGPSEAGVFARSSVVGVVAGVAAGPASGPSPPPSGGFLRLPGIAKLLLDPSGGGTGEVGQHQLDPSIRNAIEVLVNGPAASQAAVRDRLLRAAGLGDPRGSSAPGSQPLLGDSPSRNAPEGGEDDAAERYSYVAGANQPPGGAPSSAQDAARPRSPYSHKAAGDSGRDAPSAPGFVLTPLRPALRHPSDTGNRSLDSGPAEGASLLVEKSLDAPRLSALLLCATQEVERARGEARTAALAVLGAVAQRFRTAVALEVQLQQQQQQLQQQGTHGVAHETAAAAAAAVAEVAGLRLRAASLEGELEVAGRTMGEAQSRAGSLQLQLEAAAAQQAALKHQLSRAASHARDTSAAAVASALADAEVTWTRRAEAQASAASAAALGAARRSWAAEAASAASAAATKAAAAVRAEAERTLGRSCAARDAAHAQATARAAEEHAAALAGALAASEATWGARLASAEAAAEQQRAAAVEDATATAVASGRATGAAEASAALRAHLETVKRDVAAAAAEEVSKARTSGAALAEAAFRRGEAAAAARCAAVHERELGVALGALRREHEEAAARAARVHAAAMTRLEGEMREARTVGVTAAEEAVRAETRAVLESARVTIEALHAQLLEARGAVGAERAEAEQRRAEAEGLHAAALQAASAAAEAREAELRRRHSAHVVGLQAAFDSTLAAAVEGTRAECRATGEEEARALGAAAAAAAELELRAAGQAADRALEAQRAEAEAESARLRTALVSCELRADRAESVATANGERAVAEAEAHSGVRALLGEAEARLQASEAALAALRLASEEARVALERECEATVAEVRAAGEQALGGARAEMAAMAGGAAQQLEAERAAFGLERQALLSARAEAEAGFEARLSSAALQSQLSSAAEEAASHLRAQLAAALAAAEGALAEGEEGRRATSQSLARVQGELDAALPQITELQARITSLTTAAEQAGSRLSAAAALLLSTQSSLEAETSRTASLQAEADDLRVQLTALQAQSTRRRESNELAVLALSAAEQAAALSEARLKECRASGELQASESALQVLHLSAALSQAQGELEREREARRAAATPSSMTVDSEAQTTPIWSSTPSYGPPKPTPAAVSLHEPLVGLSHLMAAVQAERAASRAAAAARDTAHAEELGRARDEALEEEEAHTAAALEAATRLACQAVEARCAGEMARGVAAALQEGREAGAAEAEGRAADRYRGEMAALTAASRGELAARESALRAEAEAVRSALISRVEIQLDELQGRWELERGDLEMGAEEARRAGQAAASVAVQRAGAAEAALASEREALQSARAELARLRAEAGESERRLGAAEARARGELERSSGAGEARARDAAMAASVAVSRDLSDRWGSAVTGLVEELGALGRSLRATATEGGQATFPDAAGAAGAEGEDDKWAEDRERALLSTLEAAASMLSRDSPIVPLLPSSPSRAPPSSYSPPPVIAPLRAALSTLLSSLLPPLSSSLSLRRQRASALARRAEDAEEAARAARGRVGDVEAAWRLRLEDAVQRAVTDALGHASGGRDAAAAVAAAASSGFRAAGGAVDLSQSPRRAGSNSPGGARLRGDAASVTRGPPPPLVSFSPFAAVRRDTAAHHFWEVELGQGLQQRHPHHQQQEYQQQEYQQQEHQQQEQEENRQGRQGLEQGQGHQYEPRLDPWQQLQRGYDPVASRRLEASDLSYGEPQDQQPSGPNFTHQSAALHPLLYAASSQHENRPVAPAPPLPSSGSGGPSHAAGPDPRVRFSFSPLMRLSQRFAGAARGVFDAVLPPELGAGYDEEEEEEGRDPSASAAPEEDRQRRRYANAAARLLVLSPSSSVPTMRSSMVPSPHEKIPQGKGAAVTAAPSITRGVAGAFRSGQVGDSLLAGGGAGHSTAAAALVANLPQHPLPSATSSGGSAGLGTAPGPVHAAGSRGPIEALFPRDADAGGTLFPGDADAGGTGAPLTPGGGTQADGTSSQYWNLDAALTHRQRAAALLQSPDPPANAPKFRPFPSMAAPATAHSPVMSAATALLPLRSSLNGALQHDADNARRTHSSSSAAAESLPDETQQQQQQQTQPLDAGPVMAHHHPQVESGAAGGGAAAAGNSVYQPFSRSRNSSSLLAPSARTAGGAGGLLSPAPNGSDATPWLIRSLVPTRRRNSLPGAAVPPAVAAAAAGDASAHAQPALVEQGEEVDGTAAVAAEELLAGVVRDLSRVLDSGAGAPGSLPMGRENEGLLLRAHEALSSPLAEGIVASAAVAQRREGPAGDQEHALEGVAGHDDAASSAVGALALEITRLRAAVARLMQQQQVAVV